MRKFETSIEATSIAKTGGIASQFLKADGSVDINVVKGNSQHYTSVDDDSGVDDWYTVINTISDAYLPITLNVVSNSHSNASFIITHGYLRSLANIVCLSYGLSVNGSFKHLIGIRITSTGDVQLKLYRAAGVNISVQVIGNGYQTPVLNTVLTRETGTPTVTYSIDTLAFQTSHFNKINAQGTITAPTFIGALTGDVTGNVTGHATLDLPLIGGTLTGELKAVAISISGNSRFKLSNGNGDAGNLSTCTGDLHTWNGFGIIADAGNAFGDGTRTIAFDARVGKIEARGTIKAPTFEGTLTGHASLDALSTHNHAGVYLPIIGGTLTGQLNGVSINIAGNGAAADPYGTIAVTQPTTANYSYFGLTRQGNIGLGIGITTANEMFFGTTTAGTTGSVLLASQLKLTSALATFSGSITASGLIKGGSLHTQNGIIHADSTTSICTLMSDSGAWLKLSCQGVNTGDWTNTPTYGQIITGSDYDMSFLIQGVQRLNINKTTGNATFSSNIVASGNITASYGVLASVRSAGEIGFTDVAGNNYQNIRMQNISAQANIVAAGEITAYSDRRLKSDIKPLKLRGELLPVTYIKDGKESIGFIAQDIQKLYPELVKGEGDEMLSLNYQQLTAVLYAEIIELKNEIIELKNQVKQLINK